MPMTRSPLEPLTVSVAVAGTAAIENEDGAWSGDWTGTIDDTGLHVANGVLEGSGQYDG